METEDLDALLDQVDLAPRDSNERQQLLERALTVAQARNLEHVERMLRDELVYASTWSGHSDRALLHFTWLLGEHDKTQGALSSDILWRYKWILGSLASFPTVSLARIEALYADFERRLVEAGRSTRPSDFRKAEFASAMGQSDVATAAFRTVMLRPRSYGDDCHACELSTYVVALGHAGKYREALERSEPLLNGSGCAEVPHITLAPLSLFAERLEPGCARAAELNRQGLALQTTQNSKHVAVIAEHVHFFTRRNAFDAAGEVLATYADVKFETRDPFERMMLLHAAAVLAERVAERDPSAELPWVFPTAPRQLRTAAEVGAWLRKEASTLANAFDKRNGQDGVSRRLAWLEERAPTE